MKKPVGYESVLLGNARYKLGYLCRSGKAEVRRADSGTAWMDMYSRNANHLNVLHRMYFNQKM